ncbi:hypothetical protein KO504_03965 [Winogradskyella psychrotolerans]|uniref:DUF6607 family protein n=1 Tax=Winogradskyella psychrotolerans TaxID=1344585 RepID=UPI001C06F321|nr:DUF6607 family protein [Winogradskyella psychrotolerans]MBU2920485.1 hypothetical protein [Winogradskyella psychrotolerans]
MKKVVPVLVIVLAFTLSSNAQKKKTLDQEAIKAMCGCFEVTFNFTETFNYSNDSLYRPSETKVDKGLEYAFAIEDEDDKISIQHLLQVGRPDSPHIVKHWRQDWLFQNQEFYMYNGDNNWTFEKKSKDDVKGQWTQKVYQVDDSPRYEGSGTWVHVDGKHYWENTTTAPLPRREYTKRNDYNITLRGNRHEITDFGWVHDQDNEKVLREARKEDVIIAKEKGYNTYKKVDDSRCQASQDWWKAQQDKWALVRTKWDAVYGRNKDLTLAEKVDNKVLFKYLFDDEITAKKEINRIIESFVK